MANESFILSHLFTSQNVSRDQRFSPTREETKKTQASLTISSSIQGLSHFEGELLRYKKSSKELAISRWCVLNETSFRYYKTRVSYLSEEKPLFEVLNMGVVLVRALTNEDEYVLEILTNEEPSPPSPISSKYSSKTLSSSRHLLSRPRYLDPMPGKYTKPKVNTSFIPSPDKKINKNLGVRESKISWTTRENMMYLTEERLIFLAPGKNDWEKWQKAFRRFFKVEIS